MSQCNRFLAAAFVFPGLLLSAAGARSASPAEAVVKVKPAQVEAIGGTKLSRITLHPKAAERLDIQTGQVRQDNSGQKIVPYAAVLYDLAGAAWVYTNPEPLTFIRHGIQIALIRGEEAYLSEGPPVGTPIVMVGAAELFGTEKGVGH
jgi:hypothetical protein